MSEETPPYGSVHSIFDHNSEASLRATFAANNASRTLLQLMLDQQQPADPAKEIMQLREAAGLLAEAQRWIAVGIDGPEN